MRYGAKCHLQICGADLDKGNQYSILDLSISTKFAMTEK